MIQEAAKYNESIDEWQLKYIAFTGNNIQKVRHFSLPSLNLIFLAVNYRSNFYHQEPQESKVNEVFDDHVDFQSVYFSYKHQLKAVV